jgi:hypothetical protein
VAHVREYQAEKLIVINSQGTAFPFTQGMWLLSQLITPLNPSDFGLFHCDLPLTKHSLDNLLGRVHTPQVGLLLRVSLISPPEPSLFIIGRNTSSTSVATHGLSPIFVGILASSVSLLVSVRSLEFLLLWPPRDRQIASHSMDRESTGS